jgi:hypothetical protein
MTAYLLAGATCVMTFGGGLLAFGWKRIAERCLPSALRLSFADLEELQSKRD